MEAISKGWRGGDLPERTRALLEFGESVASDASAITEKDLSRLREQGLDDRAIFDVVGVVALFAFYNTMADGLGVDDEPEWDGRG